MLPVTPSSVQLKAFAEIIEAEVGILYAETNYFQLQRRVEEIATQLGLHAPDELFQKVRTDRTARELLLDLATNNETSFFRDPNTFRALEERLVPALRATHPEKRVLRFWSAAASTGQEAYSIALTMDAMRAKDPAVPDYTILASDISERVLKRAAAGEYTQLEVQRGLPARTLIQAFEKKGETHWVLKPEFRRKVGFQRLNLLSLWPGLPRFDVVFLRNVLIYQSAANKAAIVKRVQEQIAPGGYLVLGGSESLLGVPHELVGESVAGAHVYRKPPLR